MSLLKFADRTAKQTDFTKKTCTYQTVTQKKNRVLVIDESTTTIFTMKNGAGEEMETSLIEEKVNSGDNREVYVTRKSLVKSISELAFEVCRSFYGRRLRNAPINLHSQLAMMDELYSILYAGCLSSMMSEEDTARKEEPLLSKTLAEKGGDEGHILVLTRIGFMNAAERKPKISQRDVDYFFCPKATRKMLKDAKSDHQKQDPQNMVEMIQSSKIARQIKGAAGPSCLDADGWRRILTSASFVMVTFKQQILESAGDFPRCAAQRSDCDAVVHALKLVFEDDNCDGVLLVDIDNAFNRINRRVMVHNIKISIELEERQRAQWLSEEHHNIIKTIQELEEKENFHKLAIIILDVLPKYLRQLFKDKWDVIFPNNKWDFTTASGAFLLSQVPKGHKPMKYIANNVMKGDTGEWDPTTLFWVFLYSGLNLVAPCRVGGTIALPLLESEYIDMVREIRNTFFAHAPQASIKKDDFECIMLNLTTQTQFGGASLKTELEEIENSPIERELSMNLRQELEDQKKANNVLEDWLKNLDTRLDNVEKTSRENSEDVKNMKRTHAELSRSFEETSEIVKKFMKRPDEPRGVLQG
eukprot:gene13529-14939_t